MSKFIKIENDNRISKECCQLETNHLLNGKEMRTPKDNLYYALSHTKIKNGLYLEFGVYKGRSINHIAEKIYPKKVFGFDSFFGLPENDGKYWQDHHFTLNGKNPKTFLENVCIIEGMFENTIEKFKHKYLANNHISFLHIDCDIYSSTKVIFDQLENYIIPGTVIVFDEYWRYEEYYDHEMKAFLEYVLKNNIRYQYLSYHKNNEKQFLNCAARVSLIITE